MRLVVGCLTLVSEGKKLIPSCAEGVKNETPADVSDHED